MVSSRGTNIPDALYDQAIEGEGHAPTDPAGCGAAINVALAVRSNRVYARSLAWQPQVDRIVALLGYTTYTPGEEEFARAVACWQQGHGLAVDGIIGPNTWSRMHAALRSASNSEPATGAVLTRNFTLAEFASRGTPVPPRYLANVRRLAQSLQVLRDHLALPIRITSGYRTPAHNQSVGGAERSQHMTASAADFRVEGLPPSQVYCAIEQLIAAGRMDQGGLGIYHTHVHYDVRGHRARWAAAGVPVPRCSAVAPAASSTPAVPAGVAEITYDVVPGQEYGPKWRSQRPPGLPAHARMASRANAATSHIQRLAGAERLGDTFVTAVRHLAQTESGAMFARPANIFDARPPAQRPPGKSLITAWGAFQFNRDAWRSLPGVAPGAFPWDSTPYEEIARPIRRYARLFREVLAAGGNPVDATRGIRLCHVTPVGYRRYLDRGRRTGFAAAWHQVPADRRERIDRHLRNAGIL